MVGTEGCRRRQRHARLDEEHPGSRGGVDGSTPLPVTSVAVLVDPLATEPSTRCRWRAETERSHLRLRVERATETNPLRLVGQGFLPARRGVVTNTTTRVSEEQTCPVWTRIRPGQLGGGGLQGRGVHKIAADLPPSSRAEPAIRSPLTAGDTRPRGTVDREGHLLHPPVDHQALGDLAVGRLQTTLKHAGRAGLLPRPTRASTLALAGLFRRRTSGPPCTRPAGPAPLL